MRFSKQSILDADIDLLDPDEKAELLEKYFPESLPEWKSNLASTWEKLQREKLWLSYEGKYQFGNFGTEYRFTSDNLQHRAKVYSGIEIFNRGKGNRVTDFSKWVMSLYLGPPNPSSLAQGKHIERSVARLAKPSESSGWELIYRDPLDTKPTPLKISRLTFNSEPLWGAPDIVYRNLDTGEILIVERKASDKTIPSNGWPNLKAQLWAYSHIDEFKDAPSITLIGEIWGMNESKLTRRAVLHWTQIDKDFDAENLELFTLYGGVRLNH